MILFGLNKRAQEFLESLGTREFTEVYEQRFDAATIIKKRYVTELLVDEVRVRMSDTEDPFNLSDYRYLDSEYSEKIQVQTEEHVWTALHDGVKFIEETKWTKEEMNDTV